MRLHAPRTAGLVNRQLVQLFLKTVTQQEIYLLSCRYKKRLAQPVTVKRHCHLILVISVTYKIHILIDLEPQQF